LKDNLRLGGQTLPGQRRQGIGHVREQLAINKVAQVIARLRLVVI
jgi:hypothetical protein